MDHMLVKLKQSCMVRTIQNFEHFHQIKKKKLTIFDEVLTPFRKMFL